MNFIREVHPAGSAELFKFAPGEFVSTSKPSTVGLGQTDSR